MAADQTKTAFVICPIGSEGAATRARSDKLLKYIIKEVLEARGYTVDRADQLAEPGIITNQIVRRIVDCDVLIADLSEGNLNVFYELAIRHGLKRPFVHMINCNEKIPFDNAQVRTIQFDLTDLDSVAAAKKELGSQIQAIESSKSNAESPISVAFDLDALRSSGNTDQSVLASVFDEVAMMRADLRALRRSSVPYQASRNPRSEDEIRNIINHFGPPELKELFEEATISSFSPGDISLTTTLSPEKDEILESQLKLFLRRHSDRPWQVSVLPF